MTKEHDKEMLTTEGVGVGIYVYDNLHKFNKEFLRDLHKKIERYI